MTLARVKYVLCVLLDKTVLVHIFAFCALVVTVLFNSDSISQMTVILKHFSPFYFDSGINLRYRFS